MQRRTRGVCSTGRYTSLNNVVETLAKELADISEEVCEYACKHREKYGDTDELIAKHCEECPMMKIIY